MESVSSPTPPWEQAGPHKQSSDIAGVDFIKDNIDAEQRNHLFNKPWLAKVVSRLSAEALAMLPGAADLVVDEEKSDESSGTSPSDD